MLLKTEDSIQMTPGVILFANHRQFDKALITKYIYNEKKSDCVIQRRIKYR